MNKYYDDPPEGKLPQSEWERRYEQDLLDLYLETVGINIQDLKMIAQGFLDEQYQEYLDTPDEPEYDRMAEIERDERGE